MADGEGFEPPKVLFHTLSDFKSDAFNRSANHPDSFSAVYITVFFQKRKYKKLIILAKSQFQTMNLFRDAIHHH